MPLTTISELFSNVARTIARFPLVVFSAYAATILLVIVNHRWDQSNNLLHPYILMLMSTFLISVAVDLFIESHRFKAPVRFFGRVLVVLVGAGLYFSWFKNFPDWTISDNLQAVLFLDNLVLLVLFAAFLLPEKRNAFWQFVVTVVLRLLQAFVLFGIFYLGIVALLAAIDYLFQVRIEWMYYFDIWLVISGIFVSLFWLYGIPSNFQALDKTTYYPKFLRVLAEYFLVPLVYLYLALLYVYSLKILITWQWPLGNVSSWILGFSCVGVVTYFLLHSVKDGFLRYAEFFKKWFFVFLMPLILVLFLAAWIRVQDYGVTEARYFLLAFGLWLLVMALYFSISKIKSLKFVPVSLFVILMLSLFGPQSAFALSEKSQLGRLETMLISEGVLVDGKVVRVDASKIGEGNAQKIVNQAWYVIDNYGVDSLQPWFSQDLTFPNEVNSELGNHTKVLAIMGLDGISPYPGHMPLERAGYVFFMKKDLCEEWRTQCASNVSGYNYLLNVYLSYYPPQQNVNVKVGDKVYMLSSLTPELLAINNEDGFTVVSLNLKEFLSGLKKDFSNMVQIPSERMVVKFGNGELRLRSIGAEFDGDKFLKWESLDGELLLR